jgi:hypothetical protein
MPMLYCQLKDPKMAKTRKEKILIGASLFITFVLVVGAFTPDDKTPAEEKTQSPPSQATQKKDIKQVEQKKTVPAYEIIETANDRFDGKPTYRILIDPVDLTNDTFKEDVRRVTVDLVEKNGQKISVDIFDSKDAYEALVEKTDVNRGCVRDDSGNLVSDTNAVKACLEGLTARMETHYIAFYEGYLEGAATDHWLSYFPSASKDHATVGGFVGNDDFNPKNYNN